MSISKNEMVEINFLEIIPSSLVLRGKLLDSLFEEGLFESGFGVLEKSLQHHMKFGVRVSAGNIGE